jgi:hypothetical protein
METALPARLPRPYRLTAVPQFGLAHVERFERRLGELSADFKLPENRHLRWHLQEHILPGLAIYQVLRAEGQSTEDALAAFDRLLEAVVTPDRKRMARLGRFPWVYSLLRLTLRRAMRPYPADGWRIEWAENSREAVRFNMRSCFYFDTLSRQGAPELTASYCRGDDLIYGEMSPHLEWKRTQTIGRGADHCDFCFAPAAKPGAQSRGIRAAAGRG